MESEASLKEAEASRQSSWPHFPFSFVYFQPFDAIRRHSTPCNAMQRHATQWQQKERPKTQSRGNRRQRKRRRAHFPSPPSCPRGGGGGGGNRKRLAIPELHDPQDPHVLSTCSVIEFHPLILISNTSEEIKNKKER